MEINNDTWKVNKKKMLSISLMFCNSSPDPILSEYFGKAVPSAFRLGDRSIGIIAYIAS